MQSSHKSFAIVTLVVCNRHTSRSGTCIVASVELPSVEDIVPDGVEASSNGCKGVEEGVAHPNGEDRILLSTSLSGCDGFLVMLADKPSYQELHDAGHERTRQDEQAKPQSHLSMNQNPRCDGYCERERDEPKIEGKVGNGGEETQQGGGDPTDDEPQEKGENEQGEHLLDNHPERKPKTQLSSRIDEGHESRDEDCASEVDQQSVSRQGTYVPTQFGRHHSCGSCSRAKETEHHALQENSARLVLHSLVKQTKQGCNYCLESKQPPLPASKSHIIELDSAERQSQHAENQGGLDVSDAFHNRLSDLCGKLQTLAQKVGGTAHNHTQRQRPILEKSPEIYHSAFLFARQN